MDLFTQIKMAVSVKEAAEYYGLEVNRGNMVCCPFHNDRTPSMKLNEDYFYCFGCGATGDLRLIHIWRGRRIGRGRPGGCVCDDGGVGSDG